MSPPTEPFSAACLPYDDVADLHVAYEVKWLDVISADYKGGKLYSVPAPASGSMWMSALGVLSQFESEGEGSDIDMHRTTEAIKVSTTAQSVGDMS